VPNAGLVDATRATYNFARRETCETIRWLEWNVMLFTRDLLHAKRYQLEALFECSLENNV